MTKLPDGTCVENYTAHDVILIDSDNGTEYTIPRHPDAPIRLMTNWVRLSKYLYRVSFGDPTIMPESHLGVYLIVSSPVKIALSHVRNDLVTPNDLIHDYSGKVLACRSFAL